MPPAAVADPRVALLVDDDLGGMRVVDQIEGMAIADGKLYLLPEDGPSRLFVYSLR